MLRIESLSLTEYRHLLHCATEECTYRLKQQKQVHYVFIAQELKLDFCLTLYFLISTFPTDNKKP